MPRNHDQRVLMALDGSARSLLTVRHVARFCPFRYMDIVLFHVFSSVPECYYDLEREPSAIKAVTAVHAWEAEQRKKIDAYMQQARKILLDHGIEDGNVRIVVQKRKEGIARDIINEARSGYDAVILRRRGAGAMRSIVMGSVATKLIEKLAFVPVFIVGRRPPNQRVLVGMDGSPGAMHALEFVARRLGCGDFHVNLLHVIRGGAGNGFSGRGREVAAECMTEAEARIEAVFAEARRKLEADGFPPSRISTQIIKGAFSRAGAITAEAKAGDYATIVLGRRGESGVKDFFIGRVTNKVIHAARQHSIWIVT